VPHDRLSVKILVGLGALAAASLSPADAAAVSPYLVVPDPAAAEASPAYRHANMTDAEAFAELDRRGVLYTRIDPVPGVRAPVRLAGRLHGVSVHSALPPPQRAVSPYEILDARLLLSLDDFCALLVQHDIDEVVHYTMYRPNAAPPVHPPPVKVDERGRPRANPVKEPASRQHPRTARRDPAPARPRQRRPARGADPSSSTDRPGPTWAPPGTRHPAGLAIDVAQLHRRDGRWLSVQHDFHGRIGQRTCGEGAPVPEDADARELRALVCGAQELGIFTYVLTPDFNAAHADHFHMEIKPGVRWFLYH
jgi:hypothetical protein